MTPSRSNEGIGLVIHAANTLLSPTETTTSTAGGGNPSENQILLPARQNANVNFDHRPHGGAFTAMINQQLLNAPQRQFNFFEQQCRINGNDILNASKLKNQKFPMKASTFFTC